MDPHEMRNLRFGDKKGGFDGRTSGVSEPAVKSPRPLGTLFKTGAELLRENRNVRVTQLHIVIPRQLVDIDSIAGHSIPSKQRIWFEEFCERLMLNPEKVDFQRKRPLGR
jgi:hypothetical protein